jgi:hypothetical protein
MKVLKSQLEEYLVDVFAIIIAVITVIVAISQSLTLSMLVSTKWEALFIGMAALTSLSLFNINNWRSPAIFILLVAAFSATKYPTLHYVFAILFFVSSYLKIVTSKRFKIWAISAIPASFFLVFLKSLLIFEVIAILSILGYHVSYLIYRVKLFSNKIKSQYLAK